MARRTRSHRIVWVLAICAIVVGGWLASLRFAVDHREADGSASQPRISPAPAAPQVSVRAGTSVRAPVGAFSVKVDRVSGASANLTVASDTNDTYRFKNALPGQRLMIPSHDGTYYLDVIRISGNVVDLAMGKR